MQTELMPTQPTLEVSRRTERKPGKIFSRSGSQSARALNSSIDLNDSIGKGSTISSIAPTAVLYQSETETAGNDDILVTKTLMKLKKELADKDMELLELRNQQFRAAMQYQDFDRQLREKEGEVIRREQTISLLQEQLAEKNRMLAEQRHEMELRVESEKKNGAECLTERQLSLQSKFAKHYEQLLDEKNEEIRILTKQVELAAHEADSKGKREVRRLGGILEEQDRQLASRQEQIDMLQTELQIARKESGKLQRNPLMTHLDEELIQKRQENQELRLKIERLESVGPYEPSSEKVLRRGELDEMSEEVEQLQKMLRAVFAGEEPSLTLLIGGGATAKKGGGSTNGLGSYAEAVGRFKRGVKRLRKVVADQCAERYSSECQIQ